MPTAISFVRRAGRELLTADRTYFVRTDGSDSNSGFTNTASGAFLTIQKAVDVVCGIDLGVYDVLIQVADGTYSPVVLKTFIGSGKVTLQGNISDPSKVLCTSSVAPLDGVVGLMDCTARGSYWVIKGFKISSTYNPNSGGRWRGIVCNYSGTSVDYSNIIFEGVLFSHVATYGGKISCKGNCTILPGNYYCHWEGGDNGVIASVDPYNVVINLVGTPNFIYGFLLLTAAVANIFSFAGYTSFSGTATGRTYYIQGVSLFSGSQGNQNYLPGNLQGLILGNSVYD